MTNFNLVTLTETIITRICFCVNTGNITIKILKSISNMERQELLVAVLNVIDSEEESFKDESSSNSSSDDEELINAVAVSESRIDLRKIPRIKGYIDYTIAKYNSEEFKSHFRMFPETFEFILGLVACKISSTATPGGKKPIDAKKQLLVALWMMATPDSYRSVCEKFDLGRATALRAVRRVSHALHTLAPQFIKWPTGERAKEVARDFERFSAFPNVIGAIDGTHIRIYAPRQDPQSYINRKKTHSVQVQAVCTRNLLFTSVYAGNVGSVHDSRVFRLSPVQEYIERPDVFFPEDSHLVGDAAYGIHRNLMVPFKDNGHLTERQKNFNFCLSSSRMSIERAFGVWKGRWRSILDCLPMVTIAKIPEYLLALAVLHNICIQQGDLIPSETINLRLRNRGNLIPNGREEGNHKREIIMNNLIIRNN